MLHKLIILTGPPAAGKTTLSPVVSKALERMSGQTSLYVSSEMVMRIQTLALKTFAENPAVTFQGPQLIVHDDYRSSLTNAAICGVASLINEFLRNKINIIAEIPEAGIRTLLKNIDTKVTSSGTDIFLIWLDAPYDERLRRNESRESRLKLPNEAMAFFELNRPRLTDEPYSPLSRRILFINTSPTFDVVSRLIIDGIEAAFRD